ncbi:hypothetical protein U9M48_044305 [Paspalum notatum var. saurae]|uniref:WRKY domain-containing protein n=1 Tax=Paspalum notatum var. saurae TaxID=547442 RepID=A0AAQ3XI42_PASNO
MTSATPGSFGTLANSGPVALSFATSNFASFLGGGPSASGGGGGGADSGLSSRLRAMTPPSIPPPSPSSYLNALSGFLDSPILLTPSLFPSPTTGAFPSEPFNWMGTSSENLSGGVKAEQRQYAEDFTFQTAESSSEPAAMTAGDAQAASFPPSSVLMAPLGGGLGDSYNVERQQQPWSYQEAPPATQFEAPSAATQPDMLANGGGYSAVPAAFREQSNRASSDDGYNWRKYGQKQMKGSVNPRSYYKCSFPGCPTKKKVERSPQGQVTEIVYKGTHNHPKPQSTRRGAGGVAPAAAAAASYVLQSAGDAAPEHSFGALSGTTPVATPENSSGSFGDDEVNGVSSRLAGNYGADELDDDEPDSKKWRIDGGGGDGVSVAGNNRTVREPRVVVQTMSDIDVLDDGYRWRKYGQKVVKGNPNPRSYYKCTTAGCPVRKHVERACHDTRAVVTTYEGKHNHDVPPARGSASFYRAAVAAQVPPQAAASYQGSSLVHTDGFGGFGAAGSHAPAESGFALSGFGDPVRTAYSYTSHQPPPPPPPNQAMYYAPFAKDEPRDDLSFFEQPLLF